MICVRIYAYRGVLLQHDSRMCSLHIPRIGPLTAGLVGVVRGRQGGGCSSRRRADSQLGG